MRGSVRADAIALVLRAYWRASASGASSVRRAECTGAGPADDSRGTRGTVRTPGSGAADARRLHRRGDALHLNAFVGVIGSRLTVELRHAEASRVVQRDEPPLIVEHGTARAPSLRGRAIVQQAFVVVQ